MKPSDQPLTYETAYAELTNILQALEQGANSMDELAQNVARAKELISFCKTKLRQVQDLSIDYTTPS